MSDLIPFTYQDHPVRVIEIDGEPWFVLADLCKVLDLAKPSRVAMRIADDMKGAHQVSTPGGTQEMTIVSEAGMYEVVIRSDKPEAAAFRRWITTEVLPSIRRTGQYGAVAELGRRDLARMVIEAEDAREAAEMRAKELAPSARAWTTMVACDGDMSVDHAAKVLARDKAIRIGRNRLFTAMEEAGWIYRSGQRRQWHAYQAQIENGRLAQKLSGPFRNHRTGELEVPAPTIRVTPKGLSALHRLLDERGRSRRPARPRQEDVGMSIETLYTTGQVAQMTGLPQRTVRTMCASGAISCHKTWGPSGPKGRPTYRISDSQLEAWLRGCRQDRRAA